MVYKLPVPAKDQHRCLCTLSKMPRQRAYAARKSVSELISAASHSGLERDFYGSAQCLNNDMPSGSGSGSGTGSVTGSVTGSGTGTAIV